MLLHFNIDDQQKVFMENRSKWQEFALQMNQKNLNNRNIWATRIQHENSNALIFGKPAGTLCAYKTIKVTESNAKVFINALTKSKRMEA